jgi:hypothetical protein
MTGTSASEEDNSARIQGRSGWEGSEVTPADISWVTSTRRVPEGVACRLPTGETTPAPEPDERVVFIAHFERGFGLPASDFFRDFLDVYGLQPHHIPVNAVMILSAFVAFCEGFASIEAFAQGWARYFQLRKQVVQEPPRSKDDPPETAQEKKDRPMTLCGVATIMSRKGSDFPKVELLESCKKWQKSFFYVKNTTGVDMLNLPPFVDEPPLAMKNWTYNPKSTVVPVNALHQVKSDLRDASLTPQDLVACFISRRVSPLQRRSHKICQMSGPMDPTRHSTHELTPANILRRIKDVCKSSQATFAWGLEPYSRDRPAPMVNPLTDTYFLFRHIDSRADI